MHASLLNRALAFMWNHTWVSRKIIASGFSNAITAAHCPISTRVYRLQVRSPIVGCFGLVGTKAAHELVARNVNGYPRGSKSVILYYTNVSLPLRNAHIVYYAYSMCPSTSVRSTSRLYFLDCTHVIWSLKAFQYCGISSKLEIHWSPLFSFFFLLSAGPLSWLRLTAQTGKRAFAQLKRAKIWHSTALRTMAYAHRPVYLPGPPQATRRNQSLLWATTSSFSWRRRVASYVTQAQANACIAFLSGNAMQLHFFFSLRQWRHTQKPKRFIRGPHSHLPFLPVCATTCLSHGHSWSPLWYSPVYGGIIFISLPKFLNIAYGRELNSRPLAGLFEEADINQCEKWKHIFK